MVAGMVNCYNLDSARYAPIAGVSPPTPSAWPRCWLMSASIATTPAAASSSDNRVPPPDEAARGYLVGVMASDAMRDAIERRYGSGWRSRTATAPGCSAPKRQRPVPASPPHGSQILNQQPELIDC